jgi:CheY-like chemotaxis protein
MKEPAPALPIALIVDDNPLILSILKRMFESIAPVASQTLVFTQTYAEALALIQTHTVAIVLADYVLDEGDGLQLIREVKQRFPRAVAILSTGLDEQELQVNGSTVTVDHYLPKPYTLENVVQILSAALY